MALPSPSYKGSEPHEVDDRPFAKIAAGTIQRGRQAMFPECDGSILRQVDGAGRLGREPRTDQRHGEEHERNRYRGRRQRWEVNAAGCKQSGERVSKQAVPPSRFQCQERSQRTSPFPLLVWENTRQTG